MKKFLFTILFALPYYLSFAQIETGFKMGLSYSNLTPLCVGADCPFTSYIPGILFGFSSNISINNYLTIQPELFFVSKGFEGRPELPYAEIVNYIAAPILLNIQLTPQLALKLGPEYSYEFSHFLVNQSEFKDASGEEVRNFDFGMSVGLCVQLTPRWYIDLRYTEGFTPFRVENTRTKYRSIYLTFNRLLEFEKKKE